MAMALQEEYIYCILLPFQCTSQGPSYLNSLLGQPLPPPESMVAKVGITKNPAERLCNIYTAFKEFGEPRPLLATLSPNDDPQTAIESAKLIDDIIFIEKVHNPGNAEQDIRTIIVQTTVIDLGQPELTREFSELFKAKVPQEKKRYLDNVGITEWIIISTPLAVNLQKRFRSGGFQQWPYVPVPNGVKLTSAVSETCRTFALSWSPSQDRLIMAHSDKRLPLLFEFKALDFKQQLYCMPVRIQKPPQPRQD